MFHLDEGIDYDQYFTKATDGSNIIKSMRLAAGQ